MSAESAGSVTPEPRRSRYRSPCRQEQPPAWKISPGTPERSSPTTPGQERGTCFTCHQQGHWSRDCPSRGSRTPRTPGQSDRWGAAKHVSDVPDVECPCGAGRCAVLKSSTEKNPGRLFYRCPVRSLEEKCNFFQWCDFTSPVKPRVVSPVEQNRHDVDGYPMCPCGAGWCIVLTMEDGEHARRKYFACPVRKGEKCGFFQWHDMPSPIQHCVGSSSRHVASPVQQYLRYPECPCGAGRCRLLTMGGGEYAGRKYFACAVKKGQGACNFSQWCDALKEDNVANDNPVSKSNPPRTVFMSEEPRDAKPSLGSASGGRTPLARSDQKASPASQVEMYLFKDEDRSDPLCPIENLSLQEGNSSGAGARPGKCFRCGEEGHWVIDCVGSPPPRHR